MAGQSDLFLTYAHNGWNGQFHVYNPDDASVNFTIESGGTYTGKARLSTSETRFEFTGTAPDGRKYTSYLLMFSLVNNGDRLEIWWLGNSQNKDRIPVSYASNALLTLETIAQGLLAVILDGNIGQANMAWKNYENVSLKVPK